jgi:hypothetical protein
VRQQQFGRLSFPMINDSTTNHARTCGGLRRLDGTCQEQARQKPGPGGGLIPRQFCGQLSELSPIMQELVNYTADGTMPDRVEGRTSPVLRPAFRVFLDRIQLCKSWSTIRRKGRCTSRWPKGIAAGSGQVIGESIAKVGQEDRRPPPGRRTLRRIVPLKRIA